MAPLNPAEGLRSLSSFKQWAKKEHIESVRNEKLTVAKVLMECIERALELEAMLERLPQDSELLPQEMADPSQKTYPKYFVRGPFLVKQGQNRDKTDIYEQKIPRVEFFRITDVLQKLSHSKQEFEIQDVLSEIKAPNYQIYLALGAIQSLGLIQVPRRGTYSFVDTRSFQAESSSVWQKISANSE